MVSLNPHCRVGLARNRKDTEQGSGTKNIQLKNLWLLFLRIRRSGFLCSGRLRRRIA